MYKRQDPGNDAEVQEIKSIDGDTLTLEGELARAHADSAVVRKTSISLIPLALWRADMEDGIIHISSAVVPRPNAEITVTYTGGFPMDSVTELLDFSSDVAFGRALKQATIDLVSIIYLRRNNLDATSVSLESLSAGIRLDPEPYSLKLLKEKYYRF